MCRHPYTRISTWMRKSQSKKERGKPLPKVDPETGGPPVEAVVTLVDAASIVITAMFADKVVGQIEGRTVRELSQQEAASVAYKALDIMRNFNKTVHSETGARVAETVVICADVGKRLLEKLSRAEATEKATAKAAACAAKHFTLSVSDDAADYIVQHRNEFLALPGAVGNDEARRALAQLLVRRPAFLLEVYNRIKILAVLEQDFDVRILQGDGDLHTRAAARDIERRGKRALVLARDCDLNHIMSIEDGKIVAVDYLVYDDGKFHAPGVGVAAKLNSDKAGFVTTVFELGVGGDLCHALPFNLPHNWLNKMRAEIKHQCETQPCASYFEIGYVAAETVLEPARRAAEARDLGTQRPAVALKGGRRVSDIWDWVVSVFGEFSSLFVPGSSKELARLVTRSLPGRAVKIVLGAVEKRLACYLATVDRAGADVDDAGEWVAMKLATSLSMETPVVGARQTVTAEEQAANEAKRQAQTLPLGENMWTALPLEETSLVEEPPTNDTV